MTTPYPTAAADKVRRMADSMQAHIDRGNSLTPLYVDMEQAGIIVRALRALQEREGEKCFECGGEITVQEVDTTVDEEALLRAIADEVRETFEFTGGEVRADLEADDLAKRALARIRFREIPEAHLRAEVARLREALRTIRGDWDAPPTAGRTPAQIARAALGGKP